MIPSIEDIVSGLISGRIKKDQALAWLMQHMALVREAAIDNYIIDQAERQ